MNDAYLGLGSNIGDRQGYIHAALDRLEECMEIEVVSVSDLIDMPAESIFPQPDYLNGVCHIKTLFSPDELLEVLQGIERDLGRVSKGTKDPRTIDLDILFFNDLIVSRQDLIVPHPLAHVREFVLRPLMEIAPDLLHPVLQSTVSELMIDAACHVA